MTDNTPINPQDLLYSLKHLNRQFHPEYDSTVEALYEDRHWSDNPGDLVEAGMRMQAAGFLADAHAKQLEALKNARRLVHENQTTDGVRAPLLALRDSLLAVSLSATILLDETHPNWLLLGLIEVAGEMRDEIVEAIDQLLQDLS